MKRSPPVIRKSLAASHELGEFRYKQAVFSLDEVFDVATTGREISTIAGCLVIRYSLRVEGYDIKGVE